MLISSSRQPNRRETFHTAPPKEELHSESSRGGIEGQLRRANDRRLAASAHYSDAIDFSDKCTSISLVGIGASAALMVAGQTLLGIGAGLVCVGVKVWASTSMTKAGARHTEACADQLRLLDKYKNSPAKGS
jgi:hypothetical protein